VLNFRHIRNLPRDFAMTGLLYSIPLITIGAASIFGWMLAYLRGPAVVSDWIATAAGNDPFLIMLLLVALFVVVGDFMTPTFSIWKESPASAIPICYASAQPSNCAGICMGTEWEIVQASRPAVAYDGPGLDTTH
jgi:TRAP-type C4-dicarboxylate transport system permease large subunit